MKRLLLTGPDRNLLRCYEVLLKRRGYAVMTAPDGMQAQRLAAAERFDLALLGDAIQKIDKKRPVAFFHEYGIPVLLLSGSARPDPEADAVLPFPFVPEELFDALEQLMEKERESV